jgi:diguanylate cyclase (GGDEF)-like protein
VLRRTAGLLTRCIRETDLAARIGGDEFVLLLNETGSEGAARILERIRALVADTFRTEPVPVTVSIGAVAFTTPPADPAELVRYADAIMYTAKSIGKNQVRLEVGDQSPPPLRSGDSR